MSRRALRKYVSRMFHAFGAIACLMLAATLVKGQQPSVSAWMPRISAFGAISLDVDIPNQRFRHDRLVQPRI
jgi:hypothetical protein